VMRAGGAWLPLDPTYPRARLAFMLADAQVPVLVTESRLAEVLPEHSAETVLLDAAWPGWNAPDEPPSAAGVGPESLAYLIYTSGSTGEPKGVMVRHGGLSNLEAAHRRPFAMAPGSAMLQFASFSFDASISETITALGSGATLDLAPDEALLPGPELAELLRARRITHAILPPAVLPALEGEELPDLELLAVAGEACPPLLVERWAGKLRMWNAYGPTEDTICASMGRCRPEEEGRPAIGRPLGNQRVHVLDRRGRPVPIGVVGEACLGGAGVARGYLGRPALTAERFVPDPWSEHPGGRLYRSGDGVRLLADGRLDFLGRLDAQVKVRGFRIELGEVESALARHPAVAECAAAVRDEIPAGGGVADRTLVAYLVPRDQAPGPAELRAFLRDHLPEHMLPSAFVVLAELPLGASGKVDRRGLPSPQGRRLESAVYEAPRSEIERRIATVWQEVLGIDRVGSRDNFFDLGGHSLQLVRVREKLREAVGRDLPIVDLFQHPSVEALAEHLGGGAEPRVSPGLVRAEARRQSVGEIASEIAVIGMAGRFPGARDLDEFWTNLRDGVESVRSFSDQELLAAGVDPAMLGHPDYVKTAIVLDDVEWFDAQLFGFHPREAEILDPQQRIFLECAWEA
ncbi:MAG: amino acid adenylation domain-containing protein, partial [bacterium]|nr:amino acid adenylation domain-containing protein [bacterium]